MTPQQERISHYQRRNWDLYLDARNYKGFRELGAKYGVTANRASMIYRKIFDRRRAARFRESFRYFHRHGWQFLTTWQTDNLGYVELMDEIQADVSRGSVTIQTPREWLQPADPRDLSLQPLLEWADGWEPTL